MATELPPVDRVRGPDGVERPLMAAHIVTSTVTSTVANVGWTIGQLRQSDRFQLTETLPLLQVQTVRKHALPMLRTVVVEVLHPRPVEPTEPRTVSLGQAELVLPEDLPCTVLSAVRGTRPQCAICKRRCLYLYDVADTASPETVVCEDCDQQITQQALAEADEQATGDRRA